MHAQEAVQKQQAAKKEQAPKLAATITYGSADDDGVEIASWRSCRTDIAEIDKDGLITAKGKGTVLIIATSTEGRIFRARITFK